MTAADGRDPDLYQDQVPPFAPGIPGNGPEHEDRGIDHGVVADGHVVEPDPQPVTDIVEPAELVTASDIDAGPETVVVEATPDAPGSDAAA